MNRSRIVALILFLLASPSTPQTLSLDETCTVTTGNQTALVHPDGTYVIPNIPVFATEGFDVSQLFRVRATCRRDGEVLTGQSIFVELLPESDGAVDAIVPSELDPIPSRILLDLPAEVLPPGQSVQLTVTARYADGSVADVTPRDAGTTYLSTVPDRIQVDENGLLSSVDPSEGEQGVIISVLHQGHLISRLIFATGPSEDADGDGLPDAWEELFGLNPLLDDAAADGDGDGLTNSAEFDLGTLPNDSDTDFDGLIDGLDPDPLRPEEEPPTVMFATPGPAAVLTAGETLRLEVSALDNGEVEQVEFLAGGIVVATASAPPWSTWLAIPYGTSSLSLEARARDRAGNLGSGQVTALIEPDPLTTVVGTVVNADLAAVADAEVTLDLQGVAAEFFDVEEPLTTFPDLTGRSPDLVHHLSSLAWRNPSGLLSNDLFGVGFGADLAGRFRARLRTSVPGIYTLILGTDDGARLRIADAVLEVEGDGQYAEAAVAVDLPAGETPFVIETYHSLGDHELTLAQLSPGQMTSTLVAPRDLIAERAPSTVSQADGAFSVVDLPSVLGTLSARASTTVDGTIMEGMSNVAEPVRGGVTDLGLLMLDSSSDIEFQVSSSALGVKSHPDVAAGAVGGFLVIWESSDGGDEDPSGSTIRARAFGASGLPLGEDFLVNSYTADDQDYPAVAAGRDGNYLLVWESKGSFGNDDSFTSIQGQLVAPEGTLLGDQFQINTHIELGQRYADVAATADGGFVVVWESWPTGTGDTSNETVQGQRLNAGGERVGSQFQVNSLTPGKQNRAAVAAAPAGGFVVVWQSRASLSDVVRIRAQRFAVDGTAVGDEIAVSDAAVHSLSPAVTVEPDGEFVVLWMSTSDYTKIFGRRFSASGVPSGDEFVVGLAGFSGGAIAAAPDGGTTVLWTAEQLHGQDYTAAGLPSGEPFFVNTEVGVDPSAPPAVTFLADGSLVAVWTWSQPDSSEVFARRLP